jgi:hypothetical protein
MMTMKNTLKLEELAQLGIALFGIYQLSPGIYWWLWPFLFLVPDLSMVGYLVNTRVGAVCYNLAHHKAIAAVVLLVGWSLHAPMFLLAGLLLWAHSSFDRVLGYGLKYPDAFTHTHLGRIGNSMSVS